MSQIIHDLIKMKYVDEGYLPNWPYHMISDEEMCDAFMRLTSDVEEPIGAKHDGADDRKGKCIFGRSDCPGGFECTCEAHMRNREKNEDGTSTSIKLSDKYTYKGTFFLMYPLLHTCLNSDHSGHRCSDECTGCYKCDACGNCVGGSGCKCCKDHKCDSCAKCEVKVPMAYSDLVKSIHFYVDKFRNRKYLDEFMPDWVYSYMLGSVISVQSPKLDIHDLIHPLDVDNVDDLFEGIKPEFRHREVVFYEGEYGKPSIACFKVSKEWMQKSQTRDVPTCQICKEDLGKPHSLSCYLNNGWDSSTLVLANQTGLAFSPVAPESEETEFKVHPDYIAPEVPADVIAAGIKIRYNATMHDGGGHTMYLPDAIEVRPPTMFGETHVIKHVRMNLLDPMQEVAKLT